MVLSLSRVLLSLQVSDVIAGEQESLVQMVIAGEQESLIQKLSLQVSATGDGDVATGDAECSAECSSAFVTKCIPYKCGLGSTEPYTDCRGEVNFMRGPLAKLCSAECQDTEAMSSSKSGCEDSGGDGGGTDAGGNPPSPPAGPRPAPSPSPSPSGGDDAKEDGGLEDCSGAAGETVELEVDSKVRCFQKYTPTSHSGNLPVVVFFHGKGGRASSSCNSNGEMVKKADEHGYILVCGDAYVDWAFPEQDGDLGTGLNNPQPCTDGDTADYTYVTQLLANVKNDDRADTTKIYFVGFSQGSMMTTWASTCFAGQITGAAQAGSGVKFAGAAVTSDLCGAMRTGGKTCEVGVTDGNNIPGGACKSDACVAFPLVPQAAKNVNGDDFKWCLYAGCDDYLLGSVLSLDAHLTNLGVPHNIQSYDAAHEAPENWMDMVVKCHGWFGAATDVDDYVC